MHRLIFADFSMYDVHLHIRSEVSRLVELVPFVPPYIWRLSCHYGRKEFQRVSMTLCWYVAHSMGIWKTLSDGHTASSAWGQPLVEVFHY